jgi:rusticyanin
MQESLQHATVNQTANSVTYTGKTVSIVMWAAPKTADEKFVIGGLVNPTLHVAKGATVTLELINEDAGMPHNVVVTAAAPPYPYMTMGIGVAFPGAWLPVIPVANNGQYSVTSTHFTASASGQYDYLCQVPGHAESGMYGKFVID